MLPARPSAPRRRRPGTAARPGNFHADRFGYDFQTLCELLRSAGCRRIARSGYLQSRHAALRVDDASHVARGT
ncbi:MAG: hypothetical protein WB646_01435 [Steroidobacteraceae bacterium]